MNKLILQTTTGTPVHVDMPCPACTLATMFDFPLLTLHDDGVREIGRVRICDNCHDHPSE